jgi:hypothetical protein
MDGMVLIVSCHLQALFDHADSFAKVLIDPGTVGLFDMLLGFSH